MSDRYGPTCPACDGPATVLGVLGRVTHGRCRNCGMTFVMEFDETDGADERASIEARPDLNPEQPHGA